MKRPLRSEQFLLNLLGQKISIFPIAKGETVEKGDLVVVNTRTLQASKAKKRGRLLCHWMCGQNRNG